MLQQSLNEGEVGDNDSLVKVDLRHNRLDSMNIAGIVKNLPKRAKKDGAIIKLDGNTAIPSGNDYTSANLKNWKMTSRRARLPSPPPSRPAARYGSR